VEALATNPELRQSMSLAARERVQSRDWTKAFQAFWDASPE
jgi:hypothetical protein